MSTSVVAELGPWLSREVPWSRVSTLALPCAQTRRLPRRPDRTRRRTRAAARPGDTASVTTAPARQAPRALCTRTTSPSAMPRVAGIGRIDGDGFAAGDLAARADRARVHLAVQAIARLAGDEMKRIGRRRCAAQPFGGLDPGRMRRAVVVAEAARCARRYSSIRPDGVASLCSPDRHENRRAARIPRRAAGFRASRPPRRRRNPEWRPGWCAPHRASARRGGAARPSRRALRYTRPRSRAGAPAR